MIVSIHMTIVLHVSWNTNYWEHIFDGNNSMKKSQFISSLCDLQHSWLLYNRLIKLEISRLCPISHLELFSNIQQNAWYYTWSCSVFNYITPPPKKHAVFNIPQNVPWEAFKICLIRSATWHKMSTVFTILHWSWTTIPLALCISNGCHHHT